MTVRESTSTVHEVLFGREFPVDMVFVCLLLLGIHAVYYFLEAPSARLLASFPLLFFLPGYVFVGILFPQTGLSKDGNRLGGVRALSNVRRLDRVTLTERLALSFGLSVAFVPLFGLTLEALPVDAFDGSILPALSVFVLVGAVFASIRRLRVPVDDRFSLLTATTVSGTYESFFGGSSRTERLTNVALILSVLFAATVVGYAFAVPQDGEQFTDFRLMTEAEGGDLVLGGYPDEIAVGEGSEFVVGIDNREGHAQEYTVVVTADQVVESDGSLRVVDTRELDRFTVTTEAGERITVPHTVAPESAGDVRINYYLYQGDAPSEASAESAYRHVHVTVSVVEGDATGGQ